MSCESGAEKAYVFLKRHHFAEEFAERVRACIRTHRFRRDDSPQSIEARILFDADKIDASGALGIARTLLYKGQISQPLYSLASDGKVLDGTKDSQKSFFQEYKYKLEGIYDSFYTVRGKEIARQRQAAAVNFYQNMLQEVSVLHRDGNKLLGELFDKEGPGEEQG